MKLKRFKGGWYQFLGPTYGCCLPTETAVSKVAGSGPFLGVETATLIPDGEVEIIKLAGIGWALVSGDRQTLIFDSETFVVPTDHVYNGQSRLAVDSWTLVITFPVKRGDLRPIKHSYTLTLKEPLP